MKAPRFLFAACISLALTFTFSCSSDDDDDGGGNTGGGGSSSSAEEPVSSSSAVPQHLLTINIEPAAYGTVLRDPAEDAYDHGTVVTVTAEPEYGYEFTGWSGAATGTTNPVAITMDGNKDLTASFALASWVFIDSRDGQIYKQVEIGGEVWMAENLNYAADGSECYDNNPANCVAYGRLYNWATAKTVCPSGWHLPSDADWDELITAVGSNPGAKLKAASGWNSNGNGTDDFGFSALPGGYRYTAGNLTSFDHIGNNGFWWSSTEFDSGSAYRWGMRNISSNVSKDYFNKPYLYSVRCLRD